MVHGCDLCWFWNNWIQEPIEDVRGDQCYHRTLQKGRTHGKCCKIQDHDLLYRGNLYGGVRVGFKSEE